MNYLVAAIILINAFFCVCLWLTLIMPLPFAANSWVFIRVHTWLKKSARYNYRADLLFL